MPTTARRPLTNLDTQEGVRPWLAVAVIAVLASGVWLLWPRENKVAAVTELQQRLLEAGGTPRRADINQVIRTVDRMSRDELRATYRAAAEEWKRIKHDAINAYFQAAAADRPVLLDAHIARMVAYHDLLVAMNPRARPDSPASLPRERRRRGTESQPPKPATNAQAEKDRRELAEKFDVVLEAHAKRAGRTLPNFR